MVSKSGEVSARGGRGGRRRVFLSYAVGRGADREYALRLGAQLSRAGHEAWVAESHLALGENWSIEVGKALERSDAMVAILSAEGVKSEGVRQEVSYAIGSAKYSGRLIPVLLPGVDERDVPWILRHLDPVRAGRDASETGRKVVARLRERQRATGA